MKRRDVLKGAAVAAGVAAVGVSLEAKARTTTELKTTYSPDTRPYLLVSLSFSVVPEDLEQRNYRDLAAEDKYLTEAKAAAEARFKETGLPQFELSSYPIYRRDHGQLVQRFRAGIEAIERPSRFLPDTGPPVLHIPMEFDLYDRDGGEWLMRPDWTGEERTLLVEPHTVFVQKRWDMILRAIDKRQHMYWRQTYGVEAPYGSTKGLVSGPGYKLYREWSKEVRAKLGRVVVNYMTR